MKNNIDFFELNSASQTKGRTALFEQSSFTVIFTIKFHYLHIHTTRTDITFS